MIYVLYSNDLIRMWYMSIITIATSTCFKKLSGPFGKSCIVLEGCIPLYWKWNHVPFRGGYRAPRYGPIRRHADGSSTTTISGSHTPMRQFILFTPDKLAYIQTRYRCKHEPFLFLIMAFFTKYILRIFP